jgi:hypothetical protein
LALAEPEVRNFFNRYGLKIVNAIEKGMKAVLLTFLLAVSISVVAQTSIPGPDGWKQQNNGSHYTYTPNTLLQTNFRYELLPPEKSTDMDLADWLDQQAEKTMQSAGFTLPAGNNIERRAVRSIRIYGTMVQDRSGKPRNLFLMAYQKPDHSIRYGRITYPGNPKNNYLNTAAAHFAALAKKEGAFDADDNATASGKMDTDNSNKQKEPTTTKKATTPVPLASIR